MIAICRWHFRLHFVKWRVLYFDPNLIEADSKSPSGKVLARWGFWINDDDVLHVRSHMTSSDHSLLKVTLSFSLHYRWGGYRTTQVFCIPDSKVHRGNMGPTRVSRPQMGPMFATWTLLSGMFPVVIFKWHVTCWELNKNLTRNSVLRLEYKID